MASDIKVDLSENFAIRIINLYKHLRSNYNETVISKQILRSGTSIGANIAEAVYAESPADFEHKLKISLKEISETLYWLKLLYRTKFISAKEFTSMASDCNSLKNILTAIVNNLGCKN
jgi:four helix bundle protein